MVGFGTVQVWQDFPRFENKRESIVTNHQISENVKPLANKQTLYPISYTCEEIRNYHSYKALNKRYVFGGVLNHKSCMVEPIYPRIALENKVEGQVHVQVLVDGLGAVKSAVKAAYKTKVHPTWLGGQPVNIIGVLIYKFDLPN